MEMPTVAAGVEVTRARGAAPIEKRASGKVCRGEQGHAGRRRRLRPTSVDAGGGRAPMTRFPPALRGTLSEMLVRAVAAAWVLGFFAAVEGALLKLHY